MVADQARPEVTSFHALAAPLLREAASTCVVNSGDKSIRILVLNSSTSAADVAALKDHLLQPLLERFSGRTIEFLFANGPQSHPEAVLRAATALRQENCHVHVATTWEDAGGPLAAIGVIHLLVSFARLHWFSELPFKQSESINGAACYVNLEPRLRDLLRRKCDSNLVCFLLRRAAEMLPGGRAVLVFAGETGACDHQCSGPARAVQEAIRTLLDQGKIPREIKSEFFMKLVSWDELRLRKIFAQRPEWSVVSLGIQRVGCPHYKRLLGGSVDGRGFGLEVADRFLANEKVAPELLKAFQSGSVCSADDVEAKRNAVREQTAQIAASNPWHYSTEGMVCLLHLERRHPLLAKLESKMEAGLKLQAPAIITILQEQWRWLQLQNESSSNGLLVGAVMVASAAATAAIVSTFLLSRRCYKKL